MLVGKILMITPCGHKFHPSCLKSWMEVKLSCPTCRHTIPPLCEWNFILFYICIFLISKYQSIIKKIKLIYYKNNGF